MLLLNAVRALVRIPLVLLLTWAEVAKATVRLHLSVVWRVMTWAVALASLPVRVAGAVRRERELEAQLRCAQREVERANALLRRLGRERKMMELIIRELEDELDRNTHLHLVMATKKSKPTKPSKPHQSLAAVGATVDHKDEAVTRSVFSAALCVSVGLVMWGRGEGCITPLSAGLLAVVAISMKSVVQIISAADFAILLLSFNCFVLGALTYPILRVAI